jgi:GNAT superfamily N-acetyltransferase
MELDAALDLQVRGLSAFARVLGSCSPGSSVIEREGVTAAVVPLVPERSVANSVAYRDAGALEAAYDELADAYDRAGVAAWTVWVPEHDTEAIRLLEARGHRLDAAPAAMVLDLARLEEPDPGDLDWDDRASGEVVGRINDLAYGFEADGFTPALADAPGDLPLRLYQARVEGDPGCVVGTIDDGTDCGVYFVATMKELRGMALARRLLHLALAEARERGCTTSSLQSTMLGYPVYERLGYETAFTLEMWERRIGAP